MERIPVLILAWDYWLTVNTLYCLQQQKHVELHFLSHQDKNPFRFSRRIKSHHYFLKNAPDEARVAFIKQVVEKTGARVLMPINRVGFEFAIQNKEALQRFVALIPVPELWSFKIAEDKGQLAEFMAANAIPTPATLVNLGDNLEQRLEGFPFPALVKPRFGFGGKGSVGEPDITMFTDRAKLLEFVRRHQHLAHRLLIQSHVEGYVVGCNVLCEQGRLLAYTIQKGVLKNQHFAPSLGIEFIYDQQVSEVVSDLLAKLRWSGVANLDLIYDEKTNDVKVLEINPRFWLTINGSMVRASVNFPYLACLRALNLPIDMAPYQVGKYIPLLSFLKYKVRDRSSAGNVKFGWNEIDLRYYFSSLLSRACYFYDKKKTG